MGFRGGNFTMPHKVAVLPLLDELTEAARLMGAVNCWWRHDDRLLGDNTDGKGFLQSLRGLIDPAGKRFAILGAGGAARAIAVELALAAAADITIVNRDAGRGDQLAALISREAHVPARYIAWHGDFSLSADTEVLINATSIGMGERASARAGGVGFVAAGADRGRRRHQSAEDAAVAQSRATRLPNARWSRNADQSGRDRLQNLDRPRLRRRRDAQSGGRILGDMRNRPAAEFVKIQPPQHMAPYRRLALAAHAMADDVSGKALAAGGQWLTSRE